MSRYPTSVRAASIKCITCNAPATRTVDSEYRCVECGTTLVQGLLDLGRPVGSD